VLDERQYRYTTDRWLNRTSKLSRSWKLITGYDLRPDLGTGEVRREYEVEGRAATGKRRKLDPR